SAPPARPDRLRRSGPCWPSPPRPYESEETCFLLMFRVLNIPQGAASPRGWRYAAQQESPRTGSGRTLSVLRHRLLALGLLVALQPAAGLRVGPSDRTWQRSYSL